MMLYRLAKSVSESFGLLHQSNLRVLRRYIKATSEEELIKQIVDINEPALLRTLWEAGLPQGLQDAVLEQLEKIS